MPMSAAEIRVRLREPQLERLWLSPEAGTSPGYLRSDSSTRPVGGYTRY